ncbi:SsgA family sporulation/cell division regulator [Amycolatopsis sp. NPDC004368]
MGTPDLSRAPAHIERKIQATLVGRSTSRGAKLVVAVHYSPRDPFAVEMEFDTATPVRWVFDRRLLMLGLIGSVGDGDVHIERTADDRHVTITLRSPAGRADLDLPIDAVREFLNASYAAVPFGSEHVDVDTWIACILDGGDW